MAALRMVDSPERGVIVLDSDLKVAFANRRACEIFGATVESLAGNELPEIVPHRLAREDDVMEDVLESVFGNDTVFHRYSAPVYALDGSAAGRVEIYSDITARRELEREILDRNRELAELNELLQDAQQQLIESERMRTLGEMAAGIAHDINNVLGIILGNVQLAKRRIDDSGPLKRSIDAIELAARDAAETVRRLREIGRPIDMLACEVVDLSEIADDVVKSALPAWRESGPHDGSDIIVESRLEPGCNILGIASELREALANILLNAAQAIEREGKIEIVTSLSSGYATLTVSDNGIGMNDETRGRLFDPFFTTRGAQGTGLGMSMVHAIAIRHRGRVIVESEAGQGTSVTMKFPLLEGS